MEASCAVPGLAGVGLGLRRSMLPEMEGSNFELPVDFLELAPENWIGVGGRYGERLERLATRYPIAAHGLSLSIGGAAPLDAEFLGRIESFLDHYRCPCYSEHLSYCADDGQLYELLPIPFTPHAVEWVAERIRGVQERLGRRIAIENVSYYAAPGQVLGEIEFISAVLDRADCNLLLDVNNVYVNSVNHGYDALEFIQAMPRERIACLHVAGHYTEAPDLRIDTHGTDICEPVWALLAATYREIGLRPTVLERDFRIPPLPALLHEVERLHGLQRAIARESS